MGTAGALGATGAVFGGYSLWRMQGESAYETSLDTSRSTINESNLLAEIVRFTTLAPNSHNTQPWRFEGGLDSLSIGPDFTRHADSMSIHFRAAFEGRFDLQHPSRTVTVIC